MYASSAALLEHMVDYCHEEEKCLHNVGARLSACLSQRSCERREMPIRGSSFHGQRHPHAHACLLPFKVLLHYFSDFKALPDGCCGGSCDCCMRRMGMPGAPPTRAEVAAAKKSKGGTVFPGFVKASSLLGADDCKDSSKRGGDMQQKKKAKSRAKVKQAMPPSKTTGTSTVGHGAPFHQSSLQSRGSLEATVANPSARASLPTSRAKQMVQASVALQGQRKLAHLKEKQAVQVHGGRARGGSDDQYDDDF